jgi:hypothetical protein
MHPMALCAGAGFQTLTRALSLPYRFPYWVLRGCSVGAPWMLVLLDQPRLDPG